MLVNLYSIPENHIERQDRKKMIKLFGVLVFTMILIVLPWGLRNLKVTGQLHKDFFVEVNNRKGFIIGFKNRLAGFSLLSTVFMDTSMPTVIACHSIRHLLSFAGVNFLHHPNPRRPTLRAAPLL